MKDVDAKATLWAQDQPPKVAKTYLNDFVKFATEASPMRHARKQY